MLLLNSYRAAAVRPPLRAPATRRSSSSAAAAAASFLVSIVRVPRPDKPSLLLARAGPSGGDEDDDDAIVDIGDSSFFSTSSSSPSPSDLLFTPADEETAWLTQFLPFSRLSLDAATWLAANAERETLSPGQKVLEPGGAPALVAVRSGRVGVARRAVAVKSTASDSSSSSSSAAATPSSSTTTPSRYTAAGPGASFGAADLLANRPSRSDVIALGEAAEAPSSSSPSSSSSSSSSSVSSVSSSLETTTKILRITPSILNSLAEKFPGAERALLSGAGAAGEEAAALAAIRRNVSRPFTVIDLAKPLQIAVSFDAGRCTDCGKSEANCQCEVDDDDDDVILGPMNMGADDESDRFYSQSRELLDKDEH